MLAKGKELLEGAVRRGRDSNKCQLQACDCGNGDCGQCLPAFPCLLCHSIDTLKCLHRCPLPYYYCELTLLMYYVK